MRSLMILMALTFPLSGCWVTSLFGPDTPPAQTPTEFYCSQTEDYRYTQAELDARAPWPANLAREFRGNARRDQWCPPSEAAP